MKDYSQHKESTFILNYLQQNKKYKKIPKLFIDIGALDGVRNSNARMFMELGWKGILFEPNPNSFTQLYKNTRKLKCDIYNIAISNDSGVTGFEIVTRKNFEGHSNVNTKGNYNIFMTTLDNIISENTPVGILDIDAEGHDSTILQYILEDTKIRPHIIMVEANSDKELKLQRDLLNGSKEYKEIKKISVNTIWERVS